MRKVRENILATSGNLPIFPAGMDVFNCDAPTINVLPGQLVIYDPRTLKSLGAGFTTDDYDRIVIGVGVDENGDGVAESIRKVFGDQLWGCHIKGATAEGPTCGVAQIKDLLFKCTGCEESYSINISYEDDRTQNEFPYNRPAVHNYTVTTECTGCEDCTEEHNCQELACQLVDLINGKVGTTDPRRQSVFPKLHKNQPKPPFKVVRLFENSIDYCINPVKDGCDNCVRVEGITGINYTDNNGTAQAITFAQSVDPNNPTYSFTAQLDRIVALINKQLDGYGSAVITKGAGKCCPYQLQVNTCFADFELVGANDVMTPCNTSNPFDPVQIENECKNCGNTPSNLQFTCGIRIIADPVKLDCNCYVPNPPIGELIRKIDIFPKSGFKKGGWYVREVQNLTYPNNTGYLWQWRDYASDNGGSGRNHNPWNSSFGPLGLPHANDRANASKVKCSEMYCSFILEHNIPNTDTGVHGNVTGARGRSVVLIPSTDTTTIQEFEAAINPYLRSSKCPVKAEIRCLDPNDNTQLTDQDQDQVTPYPDYNGYIY